MENTNFEDWIYHGDDWVVSYLSVPKMKVRGPGSPQYFAIGHAFECYLKAFIAKKYGSDKVISRSHKLFEIYEELQAELTILPKVYRSEFNNYSISRERIEKMSSNEWKRYVEIDYILYMLEFTPDSKYPFQYFKSKKADPDFLMCRSYPDFRIARLLHQIRTYLQFYSVEGCDILRIALDYKYFNDTQDDPNKNRIKFLEICIFGDKN
jgi:hypothetical protein